MKNKYRAAIEILVMYQNHVQCGMKILEEDEHRWQCSKGSLGTLEKSSKLCEIVKNWHDTVWNGYSHKTEQDFDENRVFATIKFEMAHKLKRKAERTAEFGQ